MYFTGAQAKSQFSQITKNVLLDVSTLKSVFLSTAQRIGVCNTSGSGTDLPGQSCDVAESHGPLPQNASLFMGFAFMLTASSESDRLTNKLSSDDEEGEDRKQALHCSRAAAC